MQGRETDRRCSLLFEQKPNGGIRAGPEETCARMKQEEIWEHGCKTHDFASQLKPRLCKAI